MFTVNDVKLRLENIEAQRKYAKNNNYKKAELEFTGYIQALTWVISCMEIEATQQDVEAGEFVCVRS